MCDNEWEFTVPMKVKRVPFQRCEECQKRKLSTTFYHIHDTGLNAHIEYNICKKYMKEARERARK